MEVTRKNFKEALPLVSESIKKADFLVIDTEFTGLMNGRDVSVFDSPREYYATLYQGSTDFLLIQFGLCAFYWDDGGKYYMNDAYNFYLFPRGKPGPEKMFLCQSSSIDFLASQGFDFNKLIKEGISYMTEPTETKVRENLTEKQKSYAKEKNIITIPDEHKEQIEDICIKIRDFLDKKKSKEILIDKCNAFIRRLLFQELKSRFKDEIYMETIVMENSNRVLKVSRVTSENELMTKGEEKKEKEWEDFEEAVGFSKVARMISQSEKLVVGHNMLLDVMHTLNHFFQPLPFDYYSFKEFAHCMFPRLIDTKYMSSLPPFKDRMNSSVLTHLLVTLSEPPFSLPKVDSQNGRGYKQTQEKHHEAGYDAFVTGLCFLSMHSYLVSMRGEYSEHARVNGSDSAALRPFINKLYLAKTAHQDSPYMFLGGVEPSLSRDHVFYLVFPREWQRYDINNLFSPYGPITVQFLDETSALVGLFRKELAKEVYLALCKKGEYSLLPYQKYAQMKADPSNNKLNTKTWHRQDTESSYISPKSNTNAVKKGSMVTTKWRAQNISKLTLSPSPSRKRTSSGVFQVDETEPSSKRLDTSVTSQKVPITNAAVNGFKNDVKKRKSSEETANPFWQVEESELVIQTNLGSPIESSTENMPTNQQEDLEKQKKAESKTKKSRISKVLEVFDNAEIECRRVNTFKESDSWE